MLPPSLPKKRILAISSGGGHWEQLMLIREAFGEAEVTFANTISGLGEKSGLQDCTVIRDCNAKTPAAAVASFGDVWKLIQSTRPDIIITTGALPGLIALVIGKLRGSYCLWIDSVANGEQLSLSGKVASKFADLCLTQWPSVAQSSGERIRYMGSVL